MNAGAALLLVVGSLDMGQVDDRASLSHFLVCWFHELADEPIAFAYELNRERYPIRTIEFYANRRVVRSGTDAELPETVIEDVPLDELELLNESGEVVGVEISASAFEEMWERAPIVSR